jgi:NodT family efflux transporter outer membrane factor (OMF) lipoprotein
VATAIQIGSLETQVEATRELVAINTDMLKVVQYQFTRGYASKLDLAAQQTQLAQTNAALPALLKQLAQQRDLLAVLVGRFPSQAPADKFSFADLQLPQDLPLSLPSTMVEQRPDVLQAEANAQIGVAIANRLPNITLSADAGSTALAIGQLFGPGTGFWNIGSSLAATIFDGNTLLHQERAARAAYIEAAEQYRGTVQTAFQNVADTLVALQRDAEGLKAAANTLDAAKVTLDLSQRQYKDGYANYLSLLSAEQAYQQARITLVQAQATRYADTAALFQALGGGWRHRTDLANNDHDK